VAKFGVLPESIPDYLALVGDSSDGYPGVPGWGAKSAAAVLSRYGHIAAIPGSAADWDVTVRGAPALAASLSANREQALLFLDLATLRVDRSLLDSVDRLRWAGPTPGFASLSRRLDAPELTSRAVGLAEARPAPAP
jgi:5'-3' exonuclease